MKKKFIEWFTKNNNGCSPAMEDDRSFVHEKTQHMFEAYQAGVAEGEARCAALAAENAGMNAFVDALLSIAWQGCGADGAEIQELAMKNGLLRQEVYSSDEHETLVDDPGNFEDGDPVYFRIETPASDDFLAEVRAQGVEMAAKSEQFSAWVQQGLRSFAIGVRQGDECADELRKGVQS
ncbi:TPA: hypothetical protein ACOEEU_000234 [Enterobacter kobei]|uniref:hypothetical protein n=1 Tax=Enterobacter hormaechei TaxID=158836 RepID=UPI000D728C35|nr:hypothetical protein [Enterobacter hormaechei]AWQ42477.1 hypothetical protein BET69_05590 [Enterobacter hormaechei]AWQ56690.1 hypothetical protein CAL61_05590 [Enterobacter hormaechei]